jgi:hypothetical protein
MTQHGCRKTQLTRGSLGGPSLWLCLTALFVAGTVPPTYAQIVQGEPGVGNPGATKLVSSPIFLDATQFGNGTDACAAINAAITQMNGTTNNGVVDARGFTGDQKCASNMFPNDATGKLLLGNVTLHVSTKQVQPGKFQVEGTGWTISTTASNTVIQACASISLPLCPNVLGGYACGSLVLGCWRCLRI